MTVDSGAGCSANHGLSRKRQVADPKGQMLFSIHVVRTDSRFSIHDCWHINE